MRSDSFQVPSSTVSVSTNASRVIAELGDQAAFPVPLGVLGPFSEWLKWPEWLRDNTSLAGRGPLSQSISMADDIQITANILDRGYGPYLLKETLSTSRLVTGPTAELIVRNAPSLDDALESLTTLIDVTNSNFSMHLVVDGPRAEVIVRPSLPLGPILDFAAAIRLVLIIRTLERFLLDGLEPVEMKLTIPHDRSIEEFGYRLIGRLTFEASENAIAFPSSWLAKANPDFDGALWHLAQQRLRVAQVTAQDRDLVKRLKLLIRYTLINEGRTPRLKEIAADEGLSVRTVGRKLAKARVQFQDLIDEERKRLIEELMDDPTLRISDIAQRSGFSAVSSFGRAFREWFGTSPAKYRVNFSGVERPA